MSYIVTYYHVRDYCTLTYSFISDPIVKVYDLVKLLVICKMVPIRI